MNTSGKLFTYLLHTYIVNIEDGTSIKMCEYMKYLGVMIDSHLKWDK